MPGTVGLSPVMAIPAIPGMAQLALADGLNPTVGAPVSEIAGAKKSSFTMVFVGDISN